LIRAAAFLDIEALTCVFQIMVPYNHTEFINIVIDLVNNNYISTDRIDDVVKRILRVKFTLGLFETPLADETLVDQLGSQVALYV
jgi:beta-glucosidase-like glycosyl hydrolase